MSEQSAQPILGLHEGCAGFVPPYLLERLASAADPAVAACARRTLLQDEALRTARARRETVAGDETPRAVAASPDRVVSDARGARTLPGDPVRREGEPATGDPAADEAYDGLGLTWELFLESFDRDSLDGRGMPLLATVHYDRDYDNAFWDGRQMVFGDGDGQIFRRFTLSLDVIGHELTHGVTEHTAGLLYRDQSGALNESISDVFGVLVRQRALGQTADQADWLIGADLFTETVQGEALRSMRAPGTAYDDPLLGRDPQPGHMDDYVSTTDDNGGVHINSGIPNRAFCEAAVTLGGYAWEAPGQIWYDVLTGDISADCDFVTFAALTVDAAVARYGAGSPEAGAVRHGWMTVGVLEADGAADQPRDDAAPAESAAGGDATPQPEAPRQEAELLLRRTGGLAGTVRERVLQFGQLPAQDAEDWRELLTGRTLQDLATQSGGADGFSYRVCCEDVAVDVTVPEPALPDRVQGLFERTLLSPG